MEPISTAASCLALLEAAVVVSKAATHLYRNVRHASKELAYLSDRILQTQSRLNVQLQFCQSLGSYDVHPLLSAEVLRVLQADLNDAQASLGAIQDFSRSVGKTNASQRVSWALYEKRKVTRVLEKLRDIDNNLCAMLATLSVSPLQEACTKGFLEIARLLLAKGAFLEHTDSCDRTAFTMLWFTPSSSFSRVDFLQTFLAYSPLPIVFGKLETSPLVSAAINGSADDLNFLIASSASLTGVDFVAERLIEYSIFGYNTATYDYLEPLMPRSWTSEVDDLGKGPLHRALSFPCSYMKDMVGRLVRTGVDVHSRTVDGSSLWDYAKICDKSAESRGRSEPGSSKSSRAYLNALLSEGLDVEVDSEGDLWWLTEERAEVLPNVPRSFKGDLAPLPTSSRALVGSL
ncbi:MAG: hypothetical protein Q9203_006161 [Teloschistes exilis]